MNKYDFLVVGAGLFGAVFAHEMTGRGKKVLVIDKRPHAGGNIYTQDIGGIKVHKYGAHIFHTDDEKIYKYVDEIEPLNPFINAPVAFYKDEVYNLPFNMNTFGQMWGIKTPQEAADIIKSQVKKSGIKTPKNLEEQAISMVGTDIYEKLIKGYTAKQWGRECRKLPAFIIKRLPVRYTYDNNYFTDRYQGIPKNGYTSLALKLLDGAELRLDTDFYGDRAYFEKISEKIVFTGMIDEYYDFRFGPLEYRSLVFEEKKFDTPNFQGNAVINHTGAEVPYTRSIEHKHFDKRTAGNTDFTIVSYEYPAEYSKTKEPYYPVNDAKNNTLYQKYRLLSENNEHIIFAGRLGAYKYMDMDDTVKAALELSKQVLCH